MKQTGETEGVSVTWNFDYTQVAMPIFRAYKAAMDKLATGKVVLTLVIAALAVYAYMLLYSIPEIMAYADGMKLPDMMPAGYSQDYVHLLLTSLGEEGRRAYLTRQIPIDMVYPLLFALGFSVLLIYLLKKTVASEKWIYWPAMIPILAGLFDYLENIGIIIMLRSYPDLSSTGVSLTSACSAAKALSTTVFWLYLIAAIVMLVKKRMVRAK